MAEKSHSFAGKRLRHLNQYTTSHLSFRERPVAAVVGCFLLLTILAPTSGAADVDAVAVQRSIDRGIAYLQVDGLMENAIASFEEAVRLDPNFAEAHGNLGMIYTQVDKTRALGHFENAIKANPNSAILKSLNDWGIHFDASSSFEAHRAMKAGIAPTKISLSAQQMPKGFGSFFPTTRGMSLDSGTTSSMPRPRL